jgi:uncharacterized protein
VCARRQIVCTALMVVLVLIGEWSIADPETSPTGNAAYLAEIKQWRKDRESALAAKNGWLTVAGLFFLKPGRNTFGSLSSNDVVLPPSVPARAGWFDVRQGRVFGQLEPGVRATFNEKPVQSGVEVELKDADDLGGKDALVLGPLKLFVHMSGERLAIRLLNEESALRKGFTNLNWFPIDEAYRVVAHFVPFESPKSVEVPNIIGDVERYTSPGTLIFTVQDREYRLEPFQVGKAEAARFFIVFKDLTSGKETYGAARFVYAKLPQAGTTVIDFNRAYNPPCAYNSFTTCPLPLPANRLNVRILAGERRYLPHAQPDRRSK